MCSVLRFAKSATWALTEPRQSTTVPKVSNTSALTLPKSPADARVVCCDATGFAAAITPATLPTRKWRRDTSVPVVIVRPPSAEYTPSKSAGSATTDGQTPSVLRVSQLMTRTLVGAAGGADAGGGQGVRGASKSRRQRVEPAVFRSG